MSTDYNALVHRAQQGDQAAIAELYNNTYNPAFFLAVKMVKNEQEALDILQNAYVSAFSHLDKLQTAERFPQWLNRIVVNRAKDQLKRKKAILFSDLTAGDEDAQVEFEDDSPFARAYSPQEHMDYHETKRLVAEILDALPHEQRVVTMMYYFEQMSVKEIALELECSENTVKSRLNYARKKIEQEVLALEKKGTKLYGLAPIPFLLWLVRQQLGYAQLPQATAAQVLQNVRATPAVVQRAAQPAPQNPYGPDGGNAPPQPAPPHSGPAASPAPNTPAFGSTPGGTASQAAGVAGAVAKKTAGKVIAGILAGALVVGGVAGAVYVAQNGQALFGGGTGSSLAAVSYRYEYDASELCQVQLSGTDGAGTLVATSDADKTHPIFDAIEAEEGFVQAASIAVFFDSLTYTVLDDANGSLANGDVVTIQASYDEAKAEELGVHFINLTFSHTVSGLP